MIDDSVSKCYIGVGVGVARMTPEIAHYITVASIAGWPCDALMAEVLADDRLLRRSQSLPDVFFDEVRWIADISWYMWARFSNMTKRRPAASRHDCLRVASRAATVTARSGRRCGSCRSPSRSGMCALAQCASSCSSSTIAASWKTPCGWSQRSLDDQRSRTGPRQHGGDTHKQPRIWREGARNPVARSSRLPGPSSAFQMRSCEPLGSNVGSATCAAESQNAPQVVMSTSATWSGQRRKPAVGDSLVASCPA